MPGVLFYDAVLARVRANGDLAIVDSWVVLLWTSQAASARRSNELLAADRECSRAD
jgi:hypothetical protein